MTINYKSPGSLAVARPYIISEIAKVVAWYYELISSANLF